MAAHRRLKLKSSLLMVVGLTTIVWSLAPAAAEARGPTPPRAEVKDPIITEFGVVATLKLAKPLASLAAGRPPHEVGLVLAIGHQRGPASGTILRLAGKRWKLQTGGRLGSGAILTAGNRAWLFASDPAGGEISQVALGGFSSTGGDGGARASLDNGGDLIEDVFHYHEEKSESRHDELFGWIASPRRLSPGEQCSEIRRQVRTAEEVLSNPSTDPPRRTGAVQRLKRWVIEARGYLAANCPPRGAAGGGSANGGPTGGGSGTSANSSPTAEITVPPKVKAGVAATFTANATDADGTVTSWEWSWGDGTTTKGTGPLPSALHTFPASGLYSVTLTITDDMGASRTTTPQIVPVSAPGTKTSDEGATAEEDQENKDFKPECPGLGEIVELDFYIRVPSYVASEGYAVSYKVQPEPLCPGDSQTVSATLEPGNAGSFKDEWGIPKDTYHVVVKISGAGAKGPAVHPLVTVSWK